jgi:hypothetical protein
VILLLTLIVIAGIASRLWPRFLPGIISKEFGDTLWASMFYLLIILAVPRVRPWRAAVVAIAITFAIEFLKLYHAPWIDRLRAGGFIGFLLGHRFLWHDFLCYAVGVMIGILIDSRSFRTTATRTEQ